jgi:thymidylate kinase
VKLIYLLGVAGTGKTTLINTLTQRWQYRQLIDKPIAHQHWLDTDIGRIVTLGKPHAVFGGTDTLSFTAIEQVNNLLSGLAKRNVALVIGEGDRFANQRFIDTAQQHATTLVFYLTAPNDVLDQRRRDRAQQHGLKQQDAKWITGRLSKHHRLAKANNAIYLNATQPTTTLAQQVLDYLHLCRQDRASIAND